MLLVFLDALAVAASWLICINARAIALRLHVMDFPDHQRKSHHKPTPLVGGMGILLPLLVWLCAAVLTGLFRDQQFAAMLMLCGAGVGLAGFADDQTCTTPLSRILALLLFLAVAVALVSALIAHSLNW